MQESSNATDCFDPTYILQALRAWQATDAMDQLAHACDDIVRTYCEAEPLHGQMLQMSDGRLIKLDLGSRRM